MRILHTSDWHLGRQFYNCSLLDDQRHVLNQICAIVAGNEVDVVIVAGDIYDRSVPPAAAVELLDQTLQILCRELAVPVILTSGNHDSGQRLAFGASHMAGSGLHVAARLWQQPEPLVLAGKGGDRVTFYPIPYVDPLEVRHQHQVDVSSQQQMMAHLCAMIAQQHSGEQAAVAIAHCFLAGGRESESERPLSLGGIDCVDAAVFAPFAYTALGHLHGSQQWREGKVTYSGTPMKYSFSEEGNRNSVTLVDIVYDKVASVRRIELVPLRNMRTLEGALENILRQGRDDANYQDYVQVRLTDTHAILDVMNKLRSVYPNVLHLERPGLMQQRPLSGRREQLERGELSMFSDFFVQTTGAELTQEQHQIIRAELEQLHREED